MGKLHELIAVANDMRGTKEKLLAEAKKTFGDRQAHFTGFQKSYESIVLDDYARDEERKPLVTTVAAKLLYVEEQISKVIDADFQRELTNTTAKADIVTVEENGTEWVVAMDVPAVALIQLESMLTTLRSQVYDQVPTLDPNVAWEWSTNDGHYVHREPRKRVTRKVQTPLVKAEATERFPAQVEIISTDETTGYYNQINLSGMTTPKKKRILLERIDRLLHAVKTARARANEATAATKKIAKDLFNYIGTKEIVEEN